VFVVQLDPHPKFCQLRKLIHAADPPIDSHTN
jgi:hypothetical protein